MDKKIIGKIWVLGLVLTLPTFSSGREGYIREWGENQGPSSGSRFLEEVESTLAEGGRNVSIGRGFEEDSLMSTETSSTIVPIFNRPPTPPYSRRGRSLEDILSLRIYFSRKFFELREEEIEAIYDALNTYETSFRNYEGGVRIFLKNNPRIFHRVLLAMDKVKKLEVRNQEGDESKHKVYELLAKPLQFYKEIEEINLNNMKAQEEEILDLFHRDLKCTPTSRPKID